MKILVFTEGTILMHRTGQEVTRGERIDQVEAGSPEVHEYSTYVPVGNAVEKLTKWKDQGANIEYLTSRRKDEEISEVQKVLDKYFFPEGILRFRKEGEEYKDVAEKVLPDILVEDDCESIGGEKEMTYTHLNKEAKEKIKLIAIPEFGGIDHLPDNLTDLESSS